MIVCGGGGTKGKCICNTGGNENALPHAGWRHLLPCTSAEAGGEVRVTSLVALFEKRTEDSGGRETGRLPQADLETGQKGPKASCLPATYQPFTVPPRATFSSPLRCSLLAHLQFMLCGTVVDLRWWSCAARLGVYYKNWNAARKETQGGKIERAEEIREAGGIVGSQEAGILTEVR
ncbi:hypothetical protein R1flu_009760 [Riccia fluitans]|uniref:Uncharacterized protein n=1 Tax=Riccia fluitans TaxID=41844 RepID=A0ABD1Z358_9MARC